MERLYLLALLSTLAVGAVIYYRAMLCCAIGIHAWYGVSAHERVCATCPAHEFLIAKRWRVR